MLAYTGLLGAAEVAPLWSMSTGGCSGYDTHCRPYSGAAGKAYNCVGCTTPNQETIRAFQGQLANVIGVMGAGSLFGAGKVVVADKVIGLNTARAVGILGTLAMQKGISPTPILAEVIRACKAQQAALEAKAVSDTNVRRAIQGVAKHVPALLVYFMAVAERFGGAVVTPPPSPPVTQPPVIDMGLSAQKRGVLFGGMVILAAATTIGFASAARRRRR